MRFVKNLRLIALVAVVAIILAAAMWPSAVQIDTVRVRRGPLQVTIDEEGTTRVRERFVVSAPVAGRLQRIELQPGDAVVRGKTVVARLTPAAPPLIDPRSQAELTSSVEAARAALGGAQAERERAAATLARARSSLQRQQTLADAGAVAREDLETAQTAVRTAEEGLRAADFAVSRGEHELQLARARLTPSASGGRTVDVLAPVDGVVLKQLRESELVVPAGDALLEIGDPHSLEIVADLLSTDAVRVSAGAPVLIDQWGGGHPLDARVRRVEPSGFMKVSALGVEEQRVNVIIDLADAERARQLGDGYRVEVRVVVWRDDDALKAPIGAFFRRGDQWATFVVDDQRVRMQPVQLGERNDREAQIAEGVHEGQTLVLYPPDTLMDGARVTVRSADQ